MKKISDEDLIGYLLGALEPNEEKQIELALRDNLSLRERLSALEDQMSGLPDRFVEIDPPEGLAEKTLNTISIVDATRPHGPEANGEVANGSEKVERVSQQGNNKRNARQATQFSNTGQNPDHELRSQSSHWSAMDMVVGAVVCFIVAALLLPSIVNSRFQSNLLVCQDNLRQIGFNLASYSDSFDGRFVIPENTDQWQASLFVQPMMEARLAEPQVLICPNDPGRDETAKVVTQLWEPISLHMPDKFVIAHEQTDSELSPEQIVSSDRAVSANEIVPRQNEILRQSEAATGSYGFPAPQLTSSGMAKILIPASPSYVLCADAACFDNPGYRSRNHGGRGQNVLLGDLSVDYICETACLPTGDHIYTNSQGRVQPGNYPGDNLIYRGVLKSEYQTSQR